MLEYILIEGFQKHKKRRIEFNSRITTICGLNDQGKTTVLRALWWVVFNDPQGDAFIRWNSKSCRVETGIDRHKVIRKKGKGVNLYKLDNKKYKAFKTNVPETISRLFNLSEINFQNEEDGLFLLSETPGQIGRKLNSIINLEAIDNLLSDAASATRKAKQTEELIEERLAIAKKKKEELSWVKEFDSDLRKVETMAKKKEQLKKEANELLRLVEEYKTYEKIQNQRVPDIARLINLNHLHTKLNEAVVSLFVYIQEWKVIHEQQDRSKERLEVLHKQIHRLTKGRCPLCGQTLKEKT